MKFLGGAARSGGISPTDHLSSDDKDTQIGAVGLFLRAPGRIAASVKLLVLGALAASLIFAALAPISRGTISPGQVITQGARIVIQHPDGGVVEKMHVREGDRVRAGQVLVSLDRQTPAIALHLLEVQRALILTERAMLQADSAGQTTITWPPEVLAVSDDPSVSQSMQTNHRVLTSRHLAHEAEKAVLEQQSARLEARIKGLEARKSGASVQAGLTDQEAEVLRELYDKGLTTRTRILSLQRSAAQLKGTVGWDPLESTCRHASLSIL